jgi:hypothetical protein
MALSLNLDGIALDKRPCELIQKIAEYLNLQTQINLARTCKMIQFYVYPVTVQTVLLDLPSNVCRGMQLIVLNHCGKPCRGIITCMAPDQRECHVHFAHTTEQEDERIFRADFACRFHVSFVPFSASSPSFFDEHKNAEEFEFNPSSPKLPFVSSSPRQRIDKLKVYWAHRPNKHLPKKLEEQNWCTHETPSLLENDYQRLAPLACTCNQPLDCKLLFYQATWFSVAQETALSAYVTTETSRRSPPLPSHPSVSRLASILRIRAAQHVSPDS